MKIWRLIIATKNWFMENHSGDIYLEAVLEEIKHIISLMDRNGASSTYGCFDRRYWSWRIGDMPNASLQYGIYPLVWLWQNDPTGKYKENNSLLEWIMAALDYWVKIQNRNGSFNQFFPNEQSVGTTYYTLSSILYAYKCMEGVGDNGFKEKIRNAIIRSGDFVRRNDETYAVISNHLALYAYVNYGLQRFLGDNKFGEKARRLLEIIFKNQSDEGWFLEYEGADPGYQTQCIYYLSGCYLLTGDSEILDRIKKSIEGFLVYCFHPDGSFGGQYGSRNTEIIYPAGFEMLKNKIPACNIISRFIRENIENEKAVSINCLDDENIIRLATNYLIAYEHCGSEGEQFCEFLTSFPFNADKAEKDFEDAGIVIRGNDKYYSIANVKKGGVIKIFDKSNKRLAYDDYGYFFRAKNLTVTNQVMQNTSPLIKASEAQCDSDCHKVLDDMLTPASNIALRLFGITIFRSIFIANLFRRFLVNLVFTGKTKYQIHVKRRIVYSNDRITISDIITKNSRLRINEEIIGRKAFGVKMVSSNYHSDEDLVEVKKEPISIDSFNIDNIIEITNEIIFI